MRPDQLELIHTVGAPRVHPSGAWAVAAVHHPSFAADSYVGQLWRVDLDGSTPPRRITRGFRDAAPEFSADGALLAFLRAEPGGRPQVFVAPADGGEPVQVTDEKLGVTDLAFSPDGTRLVYVARVPEEGRYGTLDDVGPGQEDPRHITTYQFRSNGVGWTGDQRRHLFVVDVPDPFGEPPVKPVGRAARKPVGDHADDPTDAGRSVLVPRAVRITSGDMDHSDPVWTPDGAAILAVSAREDDRDERLTTSVYRFDPAGGAEPVPVAADPTVTFGFPAFSRDGALWVLGSEIGADGRDFVARNTSVWAVPADGGRPRRLTDPESVDCGVVGLEPCGTDGVLTLDRSRGVTRVIEVSPRGVRELGTGVVAAGAADIPGDAAVAVAWADTRSPGELGVLRDGAFTALTDVAAGLREKTRVAEPTELVASAPDGYPVHGWVWRPDGDGPHPVLLSIHGGPFADYHPAWFDEFQMWTAAGYAVVACNPRGSAGYGQAHGAAIRYDFGRLDTDDVLAFLDHATATVPGLDAGRVGIMGGSYGGYLSAWIIGHDARWAGAIVERGYLDPASFIGSSDIGWFFTPQYNGATDEQLDAQSPMRLVDAVATPTFVVHSADDLRCPLDQALRYYTRLKRAGVDTELLVFPGENHELSRSGTPWHRRQRFEAFLDWWERRLPVRQHS